MRKWSVILSLVVVLAGIGVAKDFWEKKPYTEWKEKEARSILEKSPWTYEFRWGTIGNIGGNVKGPANPSRSAPGTEQGGDIDPSGEAGLSSERELVTIVRVQLFSSRPIREAYTALMAKGDAARFEKMKEFATREFTDEIVVAWTLDSKPKGVSTVFDLDKTLRAMNLSDLKNNTFLATDTGRKVYITDYIPPTADGTGAKFVFPRKLEDGTPLLDDAVKSVKFQTRKFLLKNEDVAIDATFKTKEMLFEGKLEF